MKRSLAAIAVVLLLSGCQAERTTCDRNGGDACLSAAHTSRLPPAQPQEANQP